MKVKIKYKLVAFVSSLLLFVIILLSMLILNGIKDYQKEKNEELLLNQKNLFEQYLSEELNSSHYSNNLEDKNIHLSNVNVFNKPWLNSIPASIYDTNGNIIYSYENDTKTKEVKNENIMIKYALKNKISYLQVKNNIYYYSPLKYNNTTVAILKLKDSVKDNKDFYNKVKKLFCVLGFISLLIGIVLGIIYFIPFTNDIQRMIFSVSNIKNGNFRELKLIKRKDELGELNMGIVFMSNTMENNLIELNKEKDTLKKAVEKLEILGREQKDFIGSVTHEFKTPLTAIKAYADIMQIYDQDTNLTKEASGNISKECERLSKMIDNILSLSSLERYDFEVKKRPLKVKALIEQICERMTGKIRKNGITLECNLKEVTISADEEGLRHVLINLIDNAIKYSSQNSIVSISSYCFENEAYIEISDTGIGISEKDLEKIFEPYYRVQNDRSRKTGGTGLGLAFVKNMVEKQNGRIKVESVENRGSKFTVIFPCDDKQVYNNVTF